MLTIRPATPKDYPTIAHWNENRGEPYLFQWAGFTTYTYPLTAEQVSAQANREGVHLYIALEDNIPIGAGEICDIDEEAKTGRICRLIFAEDAKNKGYGEQFLRELSHIAFAEMGLFSLSLRVYCYNINAIRCYEKAGFRVTEYFEEENSRWNHYAMELKK